MTLGPRLTLKKLTLHSENEVFHMEHEVHTPLKLRGLKNSVYKHYGLSALFCYHFCLLQQ